MTHLLTLLGSAGLSHAFTSTDSGVICDGPLPPFAYSTPPLPDGESLTLQHLCANTDQGGVEGYTVQGFCARRRLTPPPGWDQTTPLPIQQEFRVSLSALNPNGVLLRLSHYCLLRCVCNSQGDATRAPLDYSDWAVPARQSPSHSYLFNLPNLADLRPQELVGWFGGKWLEITAYSNPSQDLHTENPPNLFFGVTERALRLKTEHEIVCEGSMPTFPLPNGQDPAVYDNDLKKLCATPLDHGYNAASAGAFCRPLDGEEADIEFADEMTPQKEWTWDYGQYPHDTAVPPAAMKVRNYCWNKCTCVTGERPHTRALAGMWHWMTTHQNHFLLDRQLRDPSPPGLPATDSARPASIGCFDSLSCVVASLNGTAPHCKQGSGPKDQQYLCQLDSNGRPATTPAAVAPDDTDIDVSTSPAHHICHGSCTSVNRGCSWASTGDCVCAAPRLSIFFWFAGGCIATHVFRDELRKRSYGSDLFTSSITSSRRSVPLRPALLHSKRTASNTVISDNSTADNYNYTSLYDPSAVLTVTDQNPVVPEGVLPAPCNASYVSLACANSTDGIVHEPPNMWLGALLPSNFTLDMLYTQPPPRVPDEFYQVHSLIRSGDAGYLALASTLDPEEAYEDTDLDYTNGLTNGTLNSTVATSFGAAGSITAAPVSLSTGISTRQVSPVASPTTATWPDIDDIHVPGNHGLVEDTVNSD